MFQITTYIQKSKPKQPKSNLIMKTSDPSYNTPNFVGLRPAGVIWLAKYSILIYKSTKYWVSNDL